MEETAKSWPEISAIDRQYWQMNGTEGHFLAKFLQFH